MGGDPERAVVILGRDIENLVTGELVPQLERALAALAGDRSGGGESQTHYASAIRLAAVLGNGDLEASLRADRAFAASAGLSFYDATLVARAEVDLRRACDLTGRSPALHAQCSANLAIIIARKSTGDPAANGEEAIELLERSLEYFTEEAHPESWAMNCTNLSVRYAERLEGDPELPSG